ncbi:hypothetical protein ACHAAC_06680 [Aeromicrobium sp. CF4.19]|uniref:hypothetical protein n=1 Tax=Aeromicrobium sp. CF4.19 TaxID=3373082 RepID=UPI003EE611A7
MPTESLTAPERETIINTDDETSTVRIWTAQRSVITSMRKKPDSFHETDSGHYGATEWAEFIIPVTDVNWGALAKRTGTPRPNAATNLPSASVTRSTDHKDAA